MLALSIRQPFAEMILRGMKTVEYRSRATRVIGERFWIYASKKKGQGASGKGRENGGIWSDDLATEAAPPWMVELANGMRLFPHELPTGVIVGSAVIEKVVASGRWPVASGREGEREAGDCSSLSTGRCPPATVYQWHLTGVRRAKRLRKPTGHPQPVWFRPF